MPQEEVIDDMEEVVNEEEQDSEEEDEGGMRIDPEVLEELQYLTRNIKEDQFDVTFKGRLETLFADVASLNARFPAETSHHEGLIGSIENGMREQALMKEELNQMIVKLNGELKEMHRVNTEEKEQ
jgi:hypothetical protein